ncbi:metal-dependent hydrolase [Candidatus Microgenomates bacterium]|nr:metal-dependent hydrolase [Candidatus Microgenomates bacterium]
MALPVGHTLAGLIISKAAADKKTKFNLLTILILANLSDIDYFFGLFSNGNALTYHRSPLTHSPFFAIFVALLFWLFGKITKKNFSMRYLAAIFLIVLSHWIIDFNTFLPYWFDINSGKNGLYDFLFTHLLSFEGLYNSVIDLVFYGALYVLVVKFVLKKKLL